MQTRIPAREYSIQIGPIYTGDMKRDKFSCLLS